MFEYDDSPLVPRESAGVHFAPFELDNKTAKLDLKLCLAKRPEGLSGWLEYSTVLFEAERMLRLAQHFKTLLSAAIANPDEPLSLLPLMPPGRSGSGADPLERDTEAVSEKFHPGGPV